MDQFDNQIFRHIKIIGDQKTLTFDFDEKDIARLQPTGDYKTVPEYKKTDIEIVKDPWVQAELESFFDHVEQPNIDLEYSQIMISFIEISQNLTDQYKRIVESRKCESEVFRQSLQQYGFQYVGHLSFDQQVALSDKFENVLCLLENKPNIRAEEIIKKTNCTRDDLQIIYKLIQSSPIVFQRLRKSIYSDYFHLASEFIAKRCFDLTFFVGRSCPYRCVFCRNVIIYPDGTRHLQYYPYRKSDLLQPKDICIALDNLKNFQAQGRPISINISGGLEPLTDIEIVDFILAESARRNIRSTLYTNGYLFYGSAHVRETALKATRIRISINAADARSFTYNTGLPEKEYDLLLQGISQLADKRKMLKSKTHIALHAVITPSVINDISKLASLAYKLGLDQINYNPDYRTDYTEVESHLIKRQITFVSETLASGHLGNLKLDFGGSLLRCNSFPVDQEYFSPALIAAHKVFVDPAGVVTPIHEGGYPRGSSTEEAIATPYHLGRLTNGENLLTILSRHHELPIRHFEEMNAFEVIVASELTRLQKDREFGFEVNPYQKTYEDALDYSGNGINLDRMGTDPSNYE